MGMSPEHVKALEEELAELKNVNDGLYKQHANEKAQMQLAIEQEKNRVTELMMENQAYREENDAWRLSYGQLDADKRESEERAETEKRELEEKIAMLEESIKSFSSELVNDLEELEKEKSKRANNEEMLLELQNQINESNDRFTQLTAEYDNLHAAYEQISAERSLLEERQTELEANHQQQIEQFQQQIQQLTMEAQKWQQQIQTMTLDEEAKEVNQNAHLQKAEQQLAEKDGTIAQLQQKLRSLEEEFCVSGGEIGSGTVRDLQHQLFVKSQELVKQGEKNVLLAEKFEKITHQWQDLRAEMKDVRVVLLKGISGNDVDESLYRHVKLEELVRLRLKALEHEWLLTGSGGATACENGSGDETSETPNLHLANVETFSAVDGLGSIGRLERELRLCRSRNKRLQERTEHLEKEIDTAMNGLTEFQALKEKAVEMASRERVEKELRVKSEANYKEATEKIVALSEHIEKLMVHLKHEAAAKTKAVDAQRRTEKELQEFRDKLSILTKKNSAKDQQIQELEQGAKILEDQLRLMDEKFIEVRNKLDWTRATSQKEVKKLNNELSALRMKWQLANDTGTLNSLPDWVSVAKLTKKNKIPLGSSGSEPRLTTASVLGGMNNSKSNQQTVQGFSSPSAIGVATTQESMGVGKRFVRFDIPKLPQSEADIGTPWSDAKLSVLQRQFQDKRHA